MCCQPEDFTGFSMYSKSFTGLSPHTLKRLLSTAMMTLHNINQIYKRYFCPFPVRGIESVFFFFFFLMHKISVHGGVCFFGIQQVLEQFL